MALARVAALVSPRGSAHPRCTVWPDYKKSLYNTRLSLRHPALFPRGLSMSERKLVEIQYSAPPLRCGNLQSLRAAQGLFQKLSRV